ncbi:MAG: MFS family permease [Arenicella sp.]|jgi:MFS family permease
MFKAILPVAALLISVALLQTGNGIQGTLLPIRASIEAFSTLSIALLGSTYFLGFIIGCIYGPKLVSVVGHIRVFAAMVALASATPLGHGLVAEPFIWWVLRVATGFSFAVLYVVIESWLNESATKETRGTIFAIYLVINMTMITSGQLLLLVVDINGFELFAIASILVSISAMPIALSTGTAPKITPRVKTNLKKLYQISPAGVVGCLCVGASSGAFWALAPQYASLVGFDVSGIALFMSISVLAGAIAQLPIGMISDRIDRRVVMAVVSGLSAISGIFIILSAGDDAIHPYVLAALWGFFTFPIYGLAAAHANDFAKPDQFVEVSGGLLLVYAVGAIIGPIVAAQLMSLINAASLYGFTAAVHLFLVVFIIWRSTRRDSVPPEHQIDYIDALEATQFTSSAIDQSIQQDLVEAAELSAVKKAAE